MKKINVFFLLLCCACAKEEPMTISDPALQLKYDSKHQYTVKKGSGTIANSAIEWKTSDNKVGTIDKEGYFKGRKIGKTEVLAYTNGGTVKASVEISPYSMLFTEPAFDFNQSKQVIKSKEKRKLEDEEADGLLYAGENSKVEYVFYTFENNRLEAVLVVFASTSAVAKECGTFFLERYPVAGTIEGHPVFMDDNKTVNILLLVDDTLGLVAGYVPNTFGKRTKGSDQAYTKLMKAYATMRSKKKA